MLKTKTKKSVQSLTLSQVVKIVESIDLKQLPLNEKTHELLKKLFNKSNSLKTNHRKNSIIKNFAYEKYTGEIKTVDAYEYEVKLLMVIVLSLCFQQFLLFDWVLNFEHSF